MNELGHLKIANIRQDGDRNLSIAWNDGRADLVDVVKLRKACPCASCVDEWSGRPLLVPEQVKESVRPTRVRSIGRYAIQVFFSDGHSTGYYSFPLLRSLGSNSVQS